MLSLKGFNRSSHKLSIVALGFTLVIEYLKSEGLHSLKYLPYYGFTEFLFRRLAHQ